jgi:hypothetical protein
MMHHVFEARHQLLVIWNFFHEELFLAKADPLSTVILPSLSSQLTQYQLGTKTRLFRGSKTVLKGFFK